MAGDWMRQLDRLHAGLVRRDDPAAWVTEEDAVRASVAYPHLAVRGPVFGTAALDPAAGGGWRVTHPVTCGTPGEAREALVSLLRQSARDDTRGSAARRALLDALGALDAGETDEAEVLGVLHRVVRGEELARSGAEGLEPPRPTDQEPPHPSWKGAWEPALRDLGVRLDAEHAEAEDQGVMAGALRLALRGFAYTGTRFPARVRADSRRAVRTHPEVVLLPTGFGVVQRTGRGWAPHGRLMPTPHDARRLLYEQLTGARPADAAERDRYARAARRFRAERRADEARAGETVFRVCRVERLVRTGAEGPEPPRPSDHAEYEQG
ncbi:DUF5954 family protein [Streptomyces sp. NPDC047002]|uniref:DUF5954 family protein n=1 Tax=Streptomyces sp. NPDC047002 TaxID=3155475 RepID=UPI003453225B